ncbi:hypothetical protein KFK09_028235 [Dendrobium nobile]|uniref:Uncharacterized protein n=1 Tax=Dendrobium nobile TaxID=94219 RepID=A0A8T3A1F9_DENNO|nr:hypothetical protein KFK09_028235 [Dendrobium nobile]
MGQTLCFLRDKAQGKLQVRRICDRVFDQCADNNLLLLDKLHVATLMDFRSEYKGLDKNQFFDLIMEWIHRDLRLVLANRVILALLAAPLLAIKTKSAAMKVKRIRNVAEKVPTPLIISAYSVGLVLLQDSRVN